MVPSISNYQDFQNVVCCSCVGFEGLHRDGKCHSVARHDEYFCRTRSKTSTNSYVHYNHNIPKRKFGDLDLILQGNTG